IWGLMALMPVPPKLVLSESRLAPCVMETARRVADASPDEVKRTFRQSYRDRAGMAPSEVPQGNPFGRSKVGTRRLATPARIAARAGENREAAPGSGMHGRLQGRLATAVIKGLSMHAGHQWRWADPTLPVPVRGVDSRRVAWPRPERRVPYLQTHSLLRSRPSRSGA